ncbi:hypothetical protein Trihar35433_790 [Trichoderma harzianum]|nr:hypothetical protein Trihar35433_790 [Trichoderma harzianum]
MNSIDQEPEMATFELRQLPLEIRRLVYYQYFFNGNESGESIVPYSYSGESEIYCQRNAASFVFVSNLVVNLLSYNEAIDVLYRGASFYFDDLNVLREFLDVRRDAGNEDLVRNPQYGNI